MYANRGGILVIIRRGDSGDDIPVSGAAFFLLEQWRDGGVWQFRQVMITTFFMMQAA